MSAALLRQRALAMVAAMEAPTGPRPKMDEAGTMIASLVAVLDAYSPLINMVDRVAEEALQRVITVIEQQQRYELTDKGDLWEMEDGTFIERDVLLQRLLELNGYVSAEEIAADATAPEDL